MLAISINLALVVNLAFLLLILDHRIGCIETDGCSFPHYKYQQLSSCTLIFLIIFKMALEELRKKYK